MNEETKISVSKEEFEILKKEVTELQTAVNFLSGVYEGVKAIANSQERGELQDSSNSLTLREICKPATEKEPNQ